MTTTTGTGMASASGTLRLRRTSRWNRKRRNSRYSRLSGRLSKDHRSIVVLRDIEGFSYTEIADVLGVSVGTVKSRLARARADMKKSLIRYLTIQRV